jgi:hypothetical protein
MKTNTLSLILSAAILTACGGSDSASAPEEPIAIVPAPAPTLTKEQAMSQLLSAQADEYIVPAYTVLNTQADTFEQASIAFCSYSAPTEIELTELKGAWLALSDAWQYAKAIKMGPESDEFRSFRIQFWPDSNNAVSRGVNSLLSATEINVNTVANLQDGAQGLPALELLIFSEEQTTSLLTAENNFDRCLAVMAIAANVKNISSEILTLWTDEDSGFISDFKNGTGEYDTQQAVLEDFVTNWFELIEVIKDDKINEVKGTFIPGNALKAESNLSLSSFDNIKRNFAALEEAYLAGEGYGFDEYLSDIHENTEVNNTIINYFAEVNTLLADFDMPLSQAIAVQTERDKFVSLTAKIEELRAYLSTDFIQVTGLNPNFNSNDGD